MLPGLRLYQAIIDRCHSLAISFEEACERCGFTADVLASCFGDFSNTNSLGLLNELDRSRIDRVAAFLGCSGFRVLQMADVFCWKDYCLIQSSPVFNHPVNGLTTQEKVEHFNDVTKASIAGSADFIIDELVGATWSNDLNEAADKAQISISLLNGWRLGIIEPSLKDLATIRTMAKHLQMGTPIVMMCLGVIRESDFMLNGQPIDVETELNHALDVEVM